MIDYLAARTHLRFDSLEFYPDYVPEDPGGRLGGRSLDPVPFDGNELGEEFRTLHDPYPPAMIMGKFLLTVPQARTLLQPGLEPKLEMAKGMARVRGAVSASASVYDRDPFLTMGQALDGPAAPLAHRARACRCGCAHPWSRSSWRTAGSSASRSPATASRMNIEARRRRDGRAPAGSSATTRCGSSTSGRPIEASWTRRQLRQHRRRHPRRRRPSARSSTSS